MYTHKILPIYLNVNNYKYVKKVIAILDKLTLKLNCYADHGTPSKLQYLLINASHHHNKITNTRTK